MISKVLNTKYIIIFIILSSSLVILITPFTLSGIGFILFLLVFQMLSKRDIIFLVIISLIAVSRDVSDALRITVYLFGILYLIFIFLKDYGFNPGIYPIPPKALNIYILFIIISMILSSLFSQDIVTGLAETGRQIIFFIVWYILFSFLTEEKDVYKYSGALIASGFLIAASVVFIFLTSDKGIFIIQAQGVIHEGGTFKNVSAVGGILTISVPLSLIIIFLTQKEKKARLILFFVILFIQIIALLLTNSRAAIIAAIISIGVIFFILRRENFYKIVIPFLVFLLILFFLLPKFSEIIQLYFRLDRVFENTRYHLWDMSLGIINENIIWGTGPGQFKNYMYKHLPVMLDSWEEMQISWIHTYAGLGESHNFFLFHTAEKGILGFIVSVFLPVIFFYYSVKVAHSYFNNKRIYYLTIGIIAIGIGIFFRSFFESTGILSNGWISRDLPFGVCSAIIIFLYNKRNKTNIKNENTYSC